MLVFAISCTAIIIAGKDNTVTTADPVGVDTRVDSIDVFDKRRNKEYLIDTLK